jgi:hypothetical protein
MKKVTGLHLFLLGMVTLFFVLGTLLFIVCSKVAFDLKLPEASQYVTIAVAHGGVTLCLLALLIWLARKRLKQNESEPPKGTTGEVGENPVGH